MHVFAPTQPVSSGGVGSNTIDVRRVNCVIKVGVPLFKRFSLYIAYGLFILRSDGYCSAAPYSVRRSTQCEADRSSQKCIIKEGRP
jgi:hypothetical protein